MSGRLVYGSCFGSVRQMHQQRDLIHDLLHIQFIQGPSKELLILGLFFDRIIVIPIEHEDGFVP
ncbi:hypothetical protein D3C76_1667220 [compost metagenome]